MDERVSVYVDIHQFINYNNRFGHESGDRVVSDLESYIDNTINVDNVQVEDFKRIAGNLWFFTMSYDGYVNILRDFMLYADNTLRVKLNIVVDYKEGRGNIARHLLRVATLSGGNLLLTTD
jgi:hypothetical protein